VARAPPAQKGISHKEQRFIIQFKDHPTIGQERRIQQPMTRTEFLLEMEEILGLNPGTLKGQEKLEDLENWDSTALVSLIAMAESRSNTEITLDQVVSCSTVADLLRLVPLEGQPN
jgi:acyl carrier protein